MNALASPAWRQSCIVALVEQVVDLYRQGAEWHGPCPWCGGTDRFVVTPGTGRFWCRRCREGGDQMDFARKWWNLDFRTAVDTLERLPTREVASRGRVLETPEPSEEWRAMHLTFLAHCEKELWADTGQAAREYLHRRGLTDDTIRAARLGLSLGNELGVAGVSCVTGLTIPWYVDSRLWRIKIRRFPPPRDGARYGAPIIIRPEDRRRLGNGAHHLYGADSLHGQRVAIMVEGELDVLLLQQTLGDLAAVVTPGSCSKGLEGRAIVRLLHVSPILVALDADEAGQAAAKRLAAVSNRIRLVRVPKGKDVGEAFLLGVDLRAWVLEELRGAGVEAPAESDVGRH